MRARTWSSLSASVLAIVLPLLAAPARGEEGGRGPVPFGAAPVLSSPRGMVVSAAPEASRVGAELLAAGGNAMDAAIGTALALAVVYPQAGNLAGGGFLVARTPDGTVHALDYRETAPARASRDMFLGADGRPVPNASTATALAVATPGSVRGYAEAHRRLGRLQAPSLSRGQLPTLAHGGLKRTAHGGAGHSAQRGTERLAIAAASVDAEIVAPFFPRVP